MIHFEVCMLRMLEIFSSSETTWQLPLEGNSYSKSSLTVWGAAQHKSFITDFVEKTMSNKNRRL